MLPPIQAIQVPDVELARLMRWPRSKPFDAATTELVAQARRQFAQHARPWLHLCHVQIEQIQQSRVILHGGKALTDARLADYLRTTESDDAAVFAATAGSEIESYIDCLWAEDRPDLSFALSAMASAMVEQMLLRAHEALCGWAEKHAMSALHPMSPGNDGWDLADQRVLFDLIAADTTPPMMLLDSGALVPSRSQLAIFGLTSHTERVQYDSAMSPCTRCSLRHCAYRRAAYQEPAQAKEVAA